MNQKKKAINPKKRKKYQKIKIQIKKKIITKIF